MCADYESQICVSPLGVKGKALPDLLSRVNLYIMTMSGLLQEFYGPTVAPKIAVAVPYRECTGIEEIYLSVLSLWKYFSPTYKLHQSRERWEACKENSRAGGLR